MLKNDFPLSIFNINNKLNLFCNFIYKFIIFIIGFFILLNPSVSYCSKQNIKDNGYWYYETDIINILKENLGEKAYISEVVISFDNIAMFRNDFNNFKTELNQRPVLIPLNLSGNHWVSLAIRKKLNGDIVIFYNDSLGYDIGDAKSDSHKFIEELKKLFSGEKLEIIDLKIRQQSDRSSCGAYTAENLIILANLDADKLSEAEVREEFKKLPSTQILRNNHYQILQNYLMKFPPKDQTGKDSSTTGKDSSSFYDKIKDAFANVKNFFMGVLRFFN